TRTPAPAAPAPLSCASRVFATMSESQRIGQLFIIGLTRDHLDAAERTAVAQFHFGSVSFTAKTSAGVAAVRDIGGADQAEVTPDAQARGGALWVPSSGACRRHASPRPRRTARVSAGSPATPTARPQ